MLNLQLRSWRLHRRFINPLFSNVKLTPFEMESFENRLNKHTSWDYIVEAVEVCVTEILE